VGDDPRASPEELYRNAYNLVLHKPLGAAAVHDWSFLLSNPTELKGYNALVDEFGSQPPTWSIAFRVKACR